MNAHLKLFKYAFIHLFEERNVSEVLCTLCAPPLSPAVPPGAIKTLYEN